MTLTGHYRQNCMPHEEIEWQPSSLAPPDDLTPLR